MTDDVACSFRSRYEVPFEEACVQFFNESDTMSKERFFLVCCFTWIQDILRIDDGNNVNHKINITPKKLWNLLKHAHKSGYRMPGIITWILPDPAAIIVTQFIEPNDDKEDNNADKRYTACIMEFWRELFEKCDETSCISTPETAVDDNSNRPSKRRRTGLRTSSLASGFTSLSRGRYKLPTIFFLISVLKNLDFASDWDKVCKLAYKLPQIFKTFSENDIRAGLFLVGLENIGTRKVTEGISPSLLLSTHLTRVDLSTLYDATALHVYHLRASICQQILAFVDYLDWPDEFRSETIDACAVCMNQEHPKRYLDGIQKTEHWQCLDKRRRRRMEYTENPSISKQVMTLGFPLLIQIQIWLHQNRVELAADLARKMDSSSYLDDKIRYGVWAEIWTYLLSEGQLFLDGNVETLGYLKKKHFLYTYMAPNPPQNAKAAMMDFFQEVAQKVYNKDSASIAEKQYVLLACQQTTLRLLLKMRGLGTDTILKFVEGTVWPVEIIGYKEAQDMNEWGAQFLHQTQKVPQTLIDQTTGLINLEQRFELLSKSNEEEDNLHTCFSIESSSFLMEEMIDDKVVARKSPMVDASVTENRDSGPDSCEEGVVYEDNDKNDASSVHSYVDDEVPKNINDFQDNVEASLQDYDADVVCEDNSQDQDNEEDSIRGITFHGVEESDDSDGDEDYRKGERHDCTKDVRLNDVQNYFEDQDMSGEETDEEDGKEKCYLEEDIEVVDSLNQNEEIEILDDDSDDNGQSEDSDADVDDDSQDDFDDTDDQDGHKDEVHAQSYVETETNEGGNLYSKEKFEESYNDDGKQETACNKETNDRISNISLQNTCNAKQGGMDEIQNSKKNETDVAATGDSVGDTTEDDDEHDNFKTNQNAKADRRSDALTSNVGYASQVEDGYEPEDTHGYTEEEISEAIPTEDEEDERMLKLDSHQKDQRESSSPVGAYVQDNQSSMNETSTNHPNSMDPPSDDMDMADEHTEQEDDVGAEFSEFEENQVGTEVRSRSLVLQTLESTNDPTTLLEFAQSAQKSHDWNVKKENPVADKSILSFDADDEKEVVTEGYKSFETEEEVVDQKALENFAENGNGTDVVSPTENEVKLDRGEALSAKENDVEEKVNDFDVDECIDNSFDNIAVNYNEDSTMRATGEESEESDFRGTNANPFESSMAESISRDVQKVHDDGEKIPPNSDNISTGEISDATDQESIKHAEATQNEPDNDKIKIEIPIADSQIPSQENNSFIEDELIIIDNKESSVARYNEQEDSQELYKEDTIQLVSHDSQKVLDFGEKMPPNSDNISTEEVANASDQESIKHAEATENEPDVDVDNDKNKIDFRIADSQIPSQENNSFIEDELIIIDNTESSVARFNEQEDSQEPYKEDTIQLVSRDSQKVLDYGEKMLPNNISTGKIADATDQESIKHVEATENEPDFDADNDKMKSGVPIVDSQIPSQESNSLVEDESIIIDTKASSVARSNEREVSQELFKDDKIQPTLNKIDSSEKEVKTKEKVTALEKEEDTIVLLRYDESQGSNGNDNDASNNSSINEVMFSDNATQSISNEIVKDCAVKDKLNFKETTMIYTEGNEIQVEPVTDGHNDCTMNDEVESKGGMSIDEEESKRDLMKDDSNTETDNAINEGTGNTFKAGCESAMAKEDSDTELNTVIVIDKQTEIVDCSDRKDDEIKIGNNDTIFSEPISVNKKYIPNMFENRNEKLISPQNFKLGNSNDKKVTAVHSSIHKKLSEEKEELYSVNRMQYSVNDIVIVKTSNGYTEDAKIIKMNQDNTYDVQYILSGRKRKSVEWDQIIESKQNVDLINGTSDHDALDDIPEFIGGDEGSSKSTRKSRRRKKEKKEPADSERSISTCSRSMRSRKPRKDAEDEDPSVDDETIGSIVQNKMNGEDQFSIATVSKSRNELPQRSSKKIRSLRPSMSMRKTRSNVNEREKSDDEISKKSRLSTRSAVSTARESKQNKNIDKSDDDDERSILSGVSLRSRSSTVKSFNQKNIATQIKNDEASNKSRLSTTKEKKIVAESDEDGILLQSEASTKRTRSSNRRSSKQKNVKSDDNEASMQSGMSTRSRASDSKKSKQNNSKSDDDEDSVQSRVSTRSGASRTKNNRSNSEEKQESKLPTIEEDTCIDFSKLTVKELRLACRKRNISITGLKKAGLIKALQTRS